jgi:hypothetical protein
VAEHAASAAAVAAAATAFAAALAAEAACERVAERGGSVERETAVAVGPGRCRRPASASWKRARCPRSSRSRRRLRRSGRSSCGTAMRPLRPPRSLPAETECSAPNVSFRACEESRHCAYECDETKSFAPRDDTVGGANLVITDSAIGSIRANLVRSGGPTCDRSVTRLAYPAPGPRNASAASA